MKFNRNIKYTVRAYIHRVSINKSIKFNSKVTWRRSDNKAQTKQVQHLEGFSTFNQTLSLTLNMPYNEQLQMYGDKNTQFSVVIILGQKTKSGGIVKFNAVQLFNDNQDNIKKILPLAKCPDSNAFIEVTFSFEKCLGQYDSNDMSLLNNTQNQLQLSKVQFNDDREAIQLQKINQTIKKFENLALQSQKKLKSHKKQSTSSNDLNEKIQKLTKQRNTLKASLLTIQHNSYQKDTELNKIKLNSKKEIDQLTEKLSKFEKQQKAVTQDSETQNYKDLYQKTLKQLQDLAKQKTQHRESLDFKNNLDDVKQVANFSMIETQNYQEINKQNNQLQNQIAQTSHKMAILFNASYQYGGAKLLDYLQTAIGLTQM